MMGDKPRPLSERGVRQPSCGAALGFRYVTSSWSLSKEGMMSLVIWGGGGCRRWASEFGKDFDGICLRAMV